MTSNAAEDMSYREWGVVVSTGNVRGAHIANGIIQLLRLANDPVVWKTDDSTPMTADEYLKAVLATLRDRFGTSHELSDAQRAFCVTGFKHGRIRFDHAVGTEFEPTTDREKRQVREIAKVVEAGRQHLVESLGMAEGTLQPAIHEALSSVLNADDRVKITGASDPTTSSFGLSGITSTHTLKGMHAATFLGLLAATDPGSQAISKLYALLRDDGRDPHGALIEILRLSGVRPTSEQISETACLYPLPSGESWSRWAEIAGTMTDHLLSWSNAGASRAETWAAIVDLATLLLALRLLRWRARENETDKLILVISESESSGQTRTLVERAQVSLQGVRAGLDEAAVKAGLVKVHEKENKSNTYRPGLHALNLAASGGWLRPHDSRGGAKRYFAPGPRQFTTLVRALVDPEEGAISWPEFARRAETLGLAVGGLHEHDTARRLHSLGGAASVRSAGIVNKRHFVSLGLARRESDDVVRVDGGGDEQRR